jgi:hypothetical protein
MPYQTTVQKADAIRIGSAKIEIGDTVEALINLGAVRNVVSQESWELVKVMGDNVGEIKKFIKNHINTVTFNWAELDLTNLNAIRGGIDTYSTVAAAPVAGAEQVIPANAWAYKKFIKIEHQNGDGSAITVNSVTGGTDGALVENTDYYVGQNSIGEYGIYVIDSATVTTTNQILTINYDYTPNASKVLKTGGKVEIAPKVVRLTNVNEDGKKFQITIYKASNSSGINLTLPADDADDIWLTPVTLEGVCDASRTVGDQLMEIIDEQSVI